MIETHRPLIHYPLISERGSVEVDLDSTDPTPFDQVSNHVAELAKINGYHIHRHWLDVDGVLNFDLRYSFPV